MILMVDHEEEKLASMCEHYNQNLDQCAAPLWFCGHCVNYLVNRGCKIKGICKEERI